MPTAPVDQHGSVLYYEDSGIPGALNDYVTVVLIHGTCFHGAGYRPLIPFAEEHNLRLVLLNLRGYPGSTPYSDEELRRFEGSVDDPESAVRARGFEIAAFLRWFIESERIPQIRALSGSGGTVGGLSLLSWSGGNVQTLSMFANADKLPEETRKLLGGHLRSFILYDPSHSSAGSPPPPGLQTVFFNQTASLEEQARQFGLVVSSYYPPFTLPDKPEIDGDIAYAPRGPLQDPKYLPTTAKMSEDERRDLTHPAIFERLQHAIWSPALRLIYEANAGRVRLPAARRRDRVEEEDLAGGEGAPFVVRYDHRRGGVGRCCPRL